MIPNFLEMEVEKEVGMSYKVVQWKVRVEVEVALVKY